MADTIKQVAIVDTRAFGGLVYQDLARAGLVQAPAPGTTEIKFETQWMVFLVPVPAGFVARNLAPETPYLYLLEPAPKPPETSQDSAERGEI